MSAVKSSRLPAYLNELTFRLNRRKSRSGGILFFRALELAVIHEPVRYNDLTVERRTRDTSPIPPGRCGHPPSLDRPPEDRPWRRAGRCPGNGWNRLFRQFPYLR